MRLLLVEFFRGALRRNERSMLFPFLQGLARERGAGTLWLCYGGDVAHRDGAEVGRTLHASLPPEDLRSLSRRLESFRPTHVVTSDPLGPEARALLAARAPRAQRLVMPVAGELDDLARCGWFLEWLGLEEPASARRYLVERAVPDYAAVLANGAARSATPQITVVGGALCAYRVPLAGNPHFAGVDLGASGHRGCSFCTCATMPPLSSPRALPLPLVETQLRRVLETAGRGGRDKGRYEFFDIRAFWAFDELIALVLRLRLPPSIFLFNPRIDDVLRGRGRIEKVLPALAKAGHEVRLLSMGVENFSERENTRFNKRITLAQVDEFLAMTKDWGRRFPGVFRPFKDGRAAAELGFILFTPWTTLADLRVNLEAAAARGFPECGYWLYSVLLIEEKTPLFLLAREDGVLAGEFPDKGQYYGLFKNEGELREVRAWRFKDARVAGLFAALVRFSAAEREGASCSHFRGDPLFAAAARLHRETNAPPDGKASPLGVAFALLELLEAPAPRPSGEALLREAVARAAA
ncbi:MAG: hypothetical protein Q8T11_04285, partial [Elusimicrobiota bacterium]|nr:hypothetical protein [Elusimicrobiota bacterium]